MERTRPTMRCLREDLQLAVPPVDEPIDEIDHPLVSKATAQLSGPQAPRERVQAVDDNVLLKVKVQRWRGAVWLGDTLPWLVAAGRREAGSPDDFYSSLSAEVTAARRSYNAKHPGASRSKTYSDHLLPNVDDRERYRLEAGTRLLRRLSTTVRDLLRASLRDGHEHATDLETFDLGIQVRADHGHETYVAVRISGSVPAKLLMLIFDFVPGCDPTGWFPEDALPERSLRPGEQAWSNLMDPITAGKLLDID